MTEEWKEYVTDPRQICKYGAKCYQKSQEHHSRFKHPPQTIKRKNGDKHRNDKRPKLQGNDTEEATNDTDEKIEDTTVVSSSSVDVSEPEKSQVAIGIPKDVSFYDKQSDYSLLQDLFLTEMPSDFFKFFDCLKAEEDNFEKMLLNVNLQLIGPYDLLLGNLPIVDKDFYLIHWRFFFDPPELQAVLKTSGKSEFHIGYYRDNPNEAPVFLGSNDSSKDCHITPLADNIFGAVYLHLQSEKKKSPFASIACQKFMDKVKTWAAQHNFSVEAFNIKKRQSKIVTKTFHGAGIVVPYNKKTQLGYRPLVESDSAIKKMFAKLKSAKTQGERDKVLSELQPVITYANIAVDECDFGTGLEVGINLFCSGIKDLEPSALSCLSSVYALLKRDSFAKIIQAHLKNRRKGPDMSLLSLIS